MDKVSFIVFLVPFVAGAIAIVFELKHRKLEREKAYLQALRDPEKIHMVSSPYSHSSLCDALWPLDKSLPRQLVLAAKDVTCVRCRVVMSLLDKE